MATSAQRVWRAACPQCGAPVEFASAASASAVCSFCRSTLVRDGDALRRIGVSAELFDDHSPLQLGASGTRQGLAFTVVGRLQYGYDGGTWNEWHVLFDTGDSDSDSGSGVGEGAVRSAWLSEDNGAYVLAFDGPLPADAPADASALETLRAGQRVVTDGRGWDVASVVRARLIAAQGELPAPPRLDGEFTVVDLRNAAGEVATLDASDPLRLHWSTGRSVALSELRLAGLKEGASEATLAGRGIECPNCGYALTPTLASTKSLSCSQCSAVVDISQGLGVELQHYVQNNAGATDRGQGPQIPLGSSGTLALGAEGAEGAAGGPGASRAAPLAWQVVGYQARCDIPSDADSDTSFWREYLLYNRSEGFAFLVDSNEGWSGVRPLTGAPTVRGETAQWQGVTYRKRDSYAARVTWVQGEFYWRVQRDERALVTDYEGTGSAAARRLSREQTGSEVTWSAGETLPAATVAAAFGLAPGARAALERDVPLLSSGKSSLGAGKAIMLVVGVVVVMLLLSRCGDDGCDEVRQTFGAASTEYRQCVTRSGSGGTGRVGGGSFGGWSSGGSHK